MVGDGGNDYGKTNRMRQHPLIALGHQTIKITWFLMIFHEKCFDPTCFFPWELLGCPMGGVGNHEGNCMGTHGIQWNLMDS